MRSSTTPDLRVAPLVDTTDEIFNDLVSINLAGSFYVLREAARVMQPRAPAPSSTPAPNSRSWASQASSPTPPPRAPSWR
jgi:NAD(P)-dependent dehydrogenase (short-subunit alcohol dehydrogenase family)